jgi:hypothetical protein
MKVFLETDFWTWGGNGGCTDGGWTGAAVGSTVFLTGAARFFTARGFAAAFLVAFGFAFLLLDALISLSP